MTCQPPVRCWWMSQWTVKPWMKQLVPVSQCKLQHLCLNSTQTLKRCDSRGSVMCLSGQSETKTGWDLKTEIKRQDDAGEHGDHSDLFEQSPIGLILLHYYLWVAQLYLNTSLCLKSDLEMCKRICKCVHRLQDSKFCSVNCTAISTTLKVMQSELDLRETNKDDSWT